VACCPTNLARTLASLGAYLATADAGGIQIHQYADSRIATTLEGGGRVALEVATGYPHHGSITVWIAEADGRPWALTLRVPAWAAAAEVTDPVGRRTATPGPAVQRLMADGYGFAAEGDWKTSVMLRALKVMADGLPGGTSFMEDYTYHLAPGTS
jgi:DUF1680 family protein